VAVRLAGLEAETPMPPWPNVESTEGRWRQDKADWLKTSIIKTRVRTGRPVLSAWHISSGSLLQ
jgi:hypothetical protein